MHRMPPHLSCGHSRKVPIFNAVRDSPEESQLIALRAPNGAVAVGLRPNRRVVPVSSRQEEYRMIRTAFLGVALAFGVATVASAAVTPVPAGNANTLVIKVAEGCGPGFWRGPGGKCHPMFDGKACPPGYHIGPNRKRCWPN
jgi:hypothetical protein